MDEGTLLKKKIRIVRLLGQGGMGAVYEAFHNGLDIPVAVKQISEALKTEREVERRFVQEARLMARIHHPNVVRVFDVDHDDELGVYIVMELVRGRDLRWVLRERGRLSPADTIGLGVAIASGLDCAHRSGLVHRDIKPANILIEDETGRAVVTDFGIAKRTVIATGGTLAPETSTGTFVGTVRYSAREQIRLLPGQVIDGRADLYSLGALLYECVSGRPFLAGMSELDVAANVGYQENFRIDLELPADVPRELGALLQHCVEVDREHRPPSAQAVVRALQRLQGDAPLGRSGLAAADWSPDATPLAPVPGEARLALATAVDDSVEHAARTQAILRIQALRTDVDGAVSRFQALLRRANAADVSRDHVPKLDELSTILRRVEEAEQAGRIDVATRYLESLKARLDESHAQVETRLVGASPARPGPETTHIAPVPGAPATSVSPEGEIEGAAGGRSLLWFGLPVAAAIAAGALWAVLRAPDAQRDLPAGVQPPGASSPLPATIASPVAPPPSLTNVLPATSVIAVPEGGNVDFSVSVVGDQAGRRPQVEWLLDGEVVARDRLGFSYRPGFDDGSDEPHVVEVRIPGVAEVVRRWRVEVENVDRQPRLVRANPPPERPIDARIGDTLRFTAEAVDPDGDAVSYRWRVGGRAVPERSATFSLRVKEDTQVQLAIADASPDVGAVWTVRARMPEPTRDPSALATTMPPARDAPATTPERAGRTGDAPAIAPVLDETRANAWLDEIEQAFNRGDADTIVTLRGMGAKQAADLRRLLEARRDLRVSLTDRTFERGENGTVRARYRRTDRFSDVTSGRSTSESMMLETVLEIRGGRVVELSTRPVTG